MDDAKASRLQGAQEVRQHGGGRRLGVVEQDDAAGRHARAGPARARSSWAGVIGFQSLAHRSAPNTTRPRASSRSSRAGEEAKPGKRKNGVTGWSSRWPYSAVSSAAMPRSISAIGLLDRHAVEQRMGEGVMADRMALGESSRRTRAGSAAALRPSTKKVARTHSRASASRTRDVVARHGPSSKVSTTSFGFERQRRGEMLAAHPWRRARVDREHPRGAQRVGPARTVGRERRSTARSADRAPARRTRGSNDPPSAGAAAGRRTACRFRISHHAALVRNSESRAP